MSYAQSSTPDPGKSAASANRRYSFVCSAFAASASMLPVTTGSRGMGFSGARQAAAGAAKSPAKRLRRDSFTPTFSQFASEDATALMMPGVNPRSPGKAAGRSGSGSSPQRAA